MYPFTHSEDKYREFIAQIVTTDFDSPKEEIKQSVKRIRHPPVVPAIDEKYYNCLKNDSLRVIGGDFNSQRKESQMGGGMKGGYDVNPHSNRDQLKNMH